jgi:hypothetical protein
MTAMRPGLTVHYTGVDVDYGSQDTEAAIRGIEKYASSAGKPNEYNYVIDQHDNGLVHEYAGHFRAAHSGNFNSSHYGVLMLNGTREGLTDAQVDKFRWLRRQLQDEGRVRDTNEVVPHRAQRPTACPGDLIMLRFGDLLVPYSDGGVVPPDDDWEDTMFVAFVRHQDHPAVYIQYVNGTKRHVSNPDEMNVYKFLGLPTGDVKVMPTDAWMRAAGVIVGPVPGGVDGWGVPVG